MAIQMSKPITATASQWASAAMHLDRQSEWRTVRISGTRYVSLLSGRSNRVYLVRASANGCSCPFYANTLGQCSHMLAVYAQATEQELAEEAAEAVKMADLFTRCAAVGCAELCEGTRLCDEHAAIAERSERMAAARRRVILEGW